MRISDLMSLLQREYDWQLKNGWGPDGMLGDPEVVIDVFEVHGSRVEYKGFSHNIKIEPSSDGVYRILSCFKDSYSEASPSEEGSPVVHPS